MLQQLNVLTKKEISELNNIAVMLLDYAENQARRHNPNEYG